METSLVYDREPFTRLVGFATGIHIKTQRAAERALAPLGLTYAQFGTLAAIAERDGQSQRELAGRLETDANTVMVICDSLQKKGLAERRLDPADRRVRRISMTPDGARSFAKAGAIVEKLYRPLAEATSDADIRKALPVLEELYGRLKEREKS
jgi:MarR family transcriptional regulator for hemolysin